MTKILLVEDDKSLREIYGVRLLAEGYDIVSAGDGEQALAMAIKERPSLIVSDVMMPKISGFDMLDILRSTTETRDIKVIMMTALSSDDQRARGEQLGADRYLVKSQVGIEDVVRTVHDVLGDSAATAGTPAPQTQPVTQTQSQIPSAPATPAPEEASLPQPTAPFASPRPATLGERVINPITAPEQTGVGSVASQIEQELQAVPVEQPVAQMPEAPQFNIPAAPIEMPEVTNQYIATPVAVEQPAPAQNYAFPPIEQPQQPMQQQPEEQQFQQPQQLEQQQQQNVPPQAPLPPQM